MILFWLCILGTQVISLETSCCDPCQLSQAFSFKLSSRISHWASRLRNFFGFRAPVQGQKPESVKTPTRAHTRASKTWFVPTLPLIPEEPEG